MAKKDIKPDPPKGLTPAELSKWFKDNKWSTKDISDYIKATNKNPRIEKAKEIKSKQKKEKNKPVADYLKPGFWYDIPEEDKDPEYATKPSHIPRKGINWWRDRNKTKEPGGTTGGWEILPDKEKEGYPGGTGDGVTTEDDLISEISGANEEPLTSLELQANDSESAFNKWQRAKNRKELPKFESDDTYAADNEGYRDYGGYLMDFGKTALGAFGATKPLESYDESSDFKQMISESRNRRDLGMSPETRSQMTDMSDRIYNYDVKNIRGMSGGSGGTALANLGGASDRYYQAQGQMGVMDEQLKAQNRQQYYQSAVAGEQVNRMKWQDQRDVDMMDKQAGGMLLGDALDSIGQRKEYEDTYKKPGSPYYEYMKELTLDTRQNRGLAEHQNKLMMHKLEQEQLDVENQLQEDYDYSRLREEETKSNYNGVLKEEGKTLPIETAEDFSNYNGEEVVTGGGVDETDMLSGLGNDDRLGTLEKMNERSNEVKPDFGYSQNDMNAMSDEDLAKEGITRNISFPDEYRNPENKKYGNLDKIYYEPNPNYDPNKEKGPQNRSNFWFEKGTNKSIPIGYQYSKEEDIPSEPDEMLESQASENTIRGEYSKRKQDLMDEWYLKDEKKYNKLLKELEEEEEEAVKKSVDYTGKK
jgi:hypothetical protein